MPEYEQEQEREQEKSRSRAVWRKVALRLGVRAVVELVFWYVRDM
ncbi:hypothetical protein [Streptomyces virginiae]